MQIVMMMLVQYEAPDKTSRWVRGISEVLTERYLRGNAERRKSESKPQVGGLDMKLAGESQKGAFMLSGKCRWVTS